MSDKREDIQRENVGDRVTMVSVGRTQKKV